MFFWKKKNSDEDTNNDIISLINFPISIKSHEHQLIFCGFGDPEPMCDEIPDEKMSSKSSDIQLKLDLVFI